MDVFVVHSPFLVGLRKKLVWVFKKLVWVFKKLAEKIKKPKMQKPKTYFQPEIQKT